MLDALSLGKVFYVRRMASGCNHCWMNGGGTHPPLVELCLPNVSSRATWSSFILLWYMIQGPSVVKICCWGGVNLYFDPFLWGFKFCVMLMPVFHECLPSYAVTSSMMQCNVDRLMQGGHMKFYRVISKSRLQLAPCLIATARQFSKRGFWKLVLLMLTMKPSMQKA